MSILCKENANREKNEINTFISPEMQLILCKDNANRVKQQVFTY